ncbi:MAG: hypothetical protein IPL88_01020 [Rhizobiales bacterium]|nr:hypothetical protein [Hyphomicrobiales bacterium]
MIAYSGDEPIVLTAIIPDGGGVSSRTFRPQSQQDEILTWLEGRHGRANLYFSVNPCTREMNGNGVKSKKTDMRGMKALHVDVDPRAGENLTAERERAERVLRNYQPVPSFIIDSGNGFQGFWLLDQEQPIDGQEALAVELEGYNQYIARYLTADNCHDINRIMRLPGTINMPDAKKQRKGRVPVLASLRYADWSLRYPISEFKSLASSAIEPKSAPLPNKLPHGRTRNVRVEKVDLEKLPPGVSAKCKEIIVYGHDPDEPDRHPSRSEWVFRVLCEMVRAGVDDDTMAAIVTDADLGISESVREKRDPFREALAQIGSARAKVHDGQSSNRPLIMLNDTELHRVLDEVEDALLSMEAPVYQMNQRLVHIEPREASFAGSSGGLMIRDVSDYRLREYMVEHIAFRRMTAKDEPDTAAPTLIHAKHLLARSDKWRLRPLRAIVEAPNMRADGTVLQREGYDDASGIVASFGGQAFPHIPDAPTRDDAISSLALLKAPIALFPFVEDDGGPPGASTSRSVLLSAILTALCRRSLRSAPLHAFTAPTMGTGKSLLADVVSIIATGRSATVISQGKNEEEDEKRLLAILMQSDPIIVLDNIERPLSGDALASILTQETWASRLLGQSRQVSVSTNALFIATGNNISIKGDMSTRILICRLDAGVESPETRAFHGDLRGEVRATRPALVAAGLTILRAFHVAGRPELHRLQPFGRFETWSDMVRGALVWLGEADPCLSRSFVEQRDMARDEHRMLLDALLSTFGVGVIFQAKDLLKGLHDDEPLREVIECICPHGPNAKRLGNYLTKVSERWLHGYCIKQLPNPKQGASYKLLAQPGAAATRPPELDLGEGFEGF